MCVLYNVAEIKALHLLNGFASISVYDNVTTVKTRAASKLNTLNDCINWDSDIIITIIIIFLFA